MKKRKTRTRSMYPGLERPFSHAMRLAEQEAMKQRKLLRSQQKPPQSPSPTSAPTFSRNQKSLLEKIRKAKRIFIIGNGGSYANAIHIANDLNAVGKAAFTLDPATLTATANDYGFHFVFERWINTVGKKGDLLIALSGSGTSPNILRGLACAKRMGMNVHLITWYLKDGMDMQLSEEAQLVIGHEMMRQLRDRR